MDSSSGDDSGKVYDFKDSKTSGVVTVTKLWDDSMSNDERSIPDVTISTEPYHKNPLGYTITYHGNGLTFADGSTENEVLVNASGKIISGQFKTIPGQVKWYSDTNYTQEIVLDSNGLPSEKITGDIDLYAHEMTYILKKGSDFNSLIPASATSLIFTDKIIPVSATLIDVDADGDGGVVAWMDGTTMKVSTQIPGKQVIAATDCQKMFRSKSNLISIDFSNLNTNNVTNMSFMFYSCSGLTNLNLTPLNTQKVTDMSFMFGDCRGLTSLDLTPLDTSNVTNMSGLFYGCRGLTSLNLTPLDTQNVTRMNSIFYNCSELTSLDLTHLDTSKVTNMDWMFHSCRSLSTLSLGEKFAFIGSDYYLPSGTWYASDGTAYTSDGTTCTIPNNKADTYTKK